MRLDLCGGASSDTLHISEVGGLLPVVVVIVYRALPEEVDGKATFTAKEIRHTFVFEKRGKRALVYKRVKGLPRRQGNIAPPSGGGRTFLAW